MGWIKLLAATLAFVLLVVAVVIMSWMINKVGTWCPEVILILGLLGSAYCIYEFYKMLKEL